MCTMKEVCDQVGIPYETLRFYCKEGLIPNVKRDKSNYRDFDEQNIKWIKSLQCLRKCGMGIEDMKRYMNLCLGGPSTIPERKMLLESQKELLFRKAEEIHECIDFIDAKQMFYNDVLAGNIRYTSSLIRMGE